MTLTELQTRLQEKLDRQEALLTITDAEKRDFTDAENGEFETLTNEVVNIQKSIQIEQKKDQARAQIAMSKMAQPKKSEDQKVSERFSLLNMIKTRSEGKELTGVEKEMHQEAVNEARNSGTEIYGVGLPSFMMRVGQDASTAATASNLIATELDGTFIPALRPKTVLQSLGATMLTGLRGNLDLPAGDAISAATWEGELDANANTDPTTRKVSLTPNRLAAKTTFSKQLMYQSSFDVENWIRAELSDAVARAVDAAGIVGNSTTIDGIIGTSGTSEISFSGAPSRAKLISLQTLVAIQNADMGRLAYLMNPRAKGDLQSLETDSGSGLFVMNNPNELLGYKVGVSTLVPTDIDTNHTAIIFGNFADLVVANWGGIDITIDPFTAADNGQVKVVINTYWDVKLKQPKSFAWGSDATYATLS